MPTFAVLDVRRVRIGHFTCDDSAHSGIHNMLRRNSVALLTLAFAATQATTSIGQEILPDGSKAAQQAISGIRVPDGLKLELFAAEPQLSSPIAICLDEQGRVFVVEEYRFNRGTPENRTQDFFLEDDLQIDSLEDRLALYRKFEDRFEGGMKWFTKVSDQVRILEDKDKDGRADSSKIFAGGFNEPLDGLAAGVLAKDGDVYLTCIPNLWLLRDTDGDGRADVRKKLLTGFGVNCGFLGHDLHGLVWGPDGRLYFSVGDRGYNVTTQEGKNLYGPRRGAVFRCEPDGSHLEVVHTGLRNPQELAFDDYGNLFAADNNCDKGDLSRLVFVVEGGDSGWRMEYQTIPDPYLTGPWHAEKTWHVNAPDQPKWIVPPVGALGAGPCGFTSYPGLGLSERYNGHFFMCNYTGNGGIESFGVRRKGAGFETYDEHDFLKPIKATDVEFGYDGKMYVSDFVNLDWSGKSLGGRIYTLFDPEQLLSHYVPVMQNRFQVGFSSLDVDHETNFIGLLLHPDRRVRLRAQFEMARRGTESIFDILDTMLNELEAPEPTNPEMQKRLRLARFHSIWCLGQMIRTRPNQKALDLLRLSLTHGDSEVRAQAIRVLGDLRDGHSISKIITALKSPEARTRYSAAVALGRIGDASAVDPLVELIGENADRDAFIRHAAVVALDQLADDAQLLALGLREETSIRLAAALVMRRRKSPQIVSFLNDSDLSIATEAALAINDLPIASGMAALAATVDRVEGDPQNVSDSLVRRVINANFRIGAESNASTVARLAANPKLPTTMRAEALACLSQWEKPGPRDRVNGFWRPLQPRDAKLIRKVVEDHAPALLGSADGKLLPDVLKLVAKHDVKVDDNEIADWARDTERPNATRAAALNLLTSRKSKLAAAIVAEFLDSNVPDLRIAARQQLVESEPASAIVSIQAAMENAETTSRELQHAFAILSSMNDRTADGSIAEALGVLINEPTPLPKRWKHLRQIELDVIEAASRRNSGQIALLLDDYRDMRNQRLKTDPYAEFRATQSGGNAAAGESIFRGHRRAQCLRCHKVGGLGGDAGPELSKVAERSKGNREYLLQSLIDPHAKLARGFGTVTFVLEDGKVVSGTIQSEDSAEIVIRTPVGEQKHIAVADVDVRTSPKSPMPSVRDVLTKRELRDLVEFLSTLK